VSVRMTEEQAWAEVESAHTGIFTSLKMDGWPVSLPVWFVVVDRSIYLSTPDRSKKVIRIGNDERGCFLVERGERWAELAAVEIPVKATVVTDANEKGKVAELMNEKYQGFRTPRRKMPEATKAHYGSGTAVIRLEPAGRLLTWDNSKLRLQSVGDGSPS
jgi:general stress protein 26